MVTTGHTNIFKSENKKEKDEIIERFKNISVNYMI